MGPNEAAQFVFRIFGIFGRAARLCQKRLKVLADTR